MMKPPSLSFFITIIVAALSVAAFASGPAAPVIGTVDLAALLVFHPAMAAYDPFNHAFLKNKTTMQPQEINRLNQKTDKQITDLQEKIKPLQGRMNELRSRFDEDQRKTQGEHDKILPGLSGGRAFQENNKFSMKMNALSVKFTSQIRALQIQIDQLQASIQENLSGGPASRYTSADETQQRFADLYAEIQRITQQAASAKGISVVFDSGFSPPGGSTAASREPDLPSNFEYGEMLGMSLPQGLDRDSGAVQGFFELQRSRAEAWYRNRCSILSPFSERIQTSFVVTGGIDLTAEVMAAVLTKYRIDSKLQNAVLQAVHHGK